MCVRSIIIAGPAGIGAWILVEVESTYLQSTQHHVLFYHLLREDAYSRVVRQFSTVLQPADVRRGEAVSDTYQEERVPLSCSSILRTNYYEPRRRGCGDKRLSITHTV